MFSQIGMIGTGNMGSAVALAINSGSFEGSFQLSNRSREKAAQLADRLKNAEVVDNDRVAARCDLIFLAVKPQMMNEVLQNIAPVLAERTDRFVLVTMAAGLSCQRICEMAGASYPVIRMMPNTPAMIGCGVTQYCGLGATEEELSAFAKLLAPSGLVDPIPEKLIDAAAAVSGCGPAFVYEFIEALADGGVHCGLPRKAAQLYAAKMVAGAAEMVLATGKHPGELKDAVCSPGGTTICGIQALEESAFRAAAMNAVIAAYEKTEELK